MECEFMIESVIRFSFKYKLLVAILFLGTCIAGVYSLTRLQIDAFPDISPNLVQVFAEVEGMAAEEVEQLISRPVEVAMMGTPGVKKIRSISSHGLATVNIYFEDDVDIFFAHQQVSERLKHAEAALPEGLEIPHGLEKGPIVSGMGKILSYYVKGDGYSTTDLRTLQDWIIKRNLQTVPGVADIISQGGHVRQYQIRVSPTQLLEYDLTLADISTAVQKNNLNLGAGIVERGSEELVVRSLGLIGDAQDIETIVVRTDQGNPIYVEDVATVEFGNAFRRGVASRNGEKEIVVGGVYKLHGANSFQVIKRLKERIEAVNKTLPAGVEIVPFYDQSALVKNSISTVRGALALGLILVCLVSFVFLGNLRNAIIVVLSLPFSTLMAFALMYRYDVPGDLISFGGVAIALGMIVDATIIMVERIHVAQAKNSENSSLREIIISAGQEVGKPIFFAVAIIVIVFVPILTLEEVEGKMFQPLGFAVTMTMLGSLFYALIIAPVLYGWFGRSKKSPRRRSVKESVFHRGYKPILMFFLRQRILVVSIMLVLVSLGGVVFYRLGKEYVPRLQEGTIQVLAHMNPNISLEEISTTARQLEQDICQLGEVEYVISDIGYGEVSPHVHHTNYACISVGLRPRKEWKNASNQEELVSRISQLIENYPGATISFSQPIQHEVDNLVAGVGAAVAAKLFGPDLDVLAEKAQEIEHVLSEISGVADLRTEQFSGQTQLQIHLRRDEIARHGLSNYDIQHTIHDAVGGKMVGNVYQDEKTFGINIRFDEQYRSDEDAIKRLLVRTPLGYTVQLGELADIETVTGLRQISREDTRRFISIQCNVRGQDSGGFVEDAQQKIAETVTLPPGYYIDWGGQFELQQAANKRLAIIIPLTLLGVFILLYSLFGSLKNVLLIALNIPLALVGGILALAIFGENVSIPSTIGFIALFGIALTDGLVLISRFEYLRRDGLSLHEAIVQGSLSKLRPVIMTTLTTAFGLLPLLLATGMGSEIQRPLAIVVVGGLSSSTILTLIILPSLYWQINRPKKIIQES
jgi:heavy metal efflux system protein